MSHFNSKRSNIIPWKLTYPILVKGISTTQKCRKWERIWIRSLVSHDFFSLAIRTFVKFGDILKPLLISVESFYTQILVRASSSRYLLITQIEVTFSPKNKGHELTKDKKAIRKNPIASISSIQNPLDSCWFQRWNLSTTFQPLKATSQTPRSVTPFNFGSFRGRRRLFVFFRNKTWKKHAFWCWFVSFFGVFVFALFFGGQAQFLKSTSNCVATLPKVGLFSCANWVPEMGYYKGGLGGVFLVIFWSYGAPIKWITGVFPTSAIKWRYGTLHIFNIWWGVPPSFFMIQFHPRIFFKSVAQPRN